MAGKPAATVTSMHVCPMQTPGLPPIPHVGGPVTGPGALNVLINNKPAALMGDMATCIGPPDTIIMGNMSVMVNNTPIACVGDMTAHGGSITVGEPNVMIGTATPQPSGIMPLHEIPFPKITIRSIAVASLSGQGKSLKEAKNKIEKLKEDAKEHGYLPEFSFSV